MESSSEGDILCFSPSARPSASKFIRHPKLEVSKRLIRRISRKFGRREKSLNSLNTLSFAPFNITPSFALTNLFVKSQKSEYSNIVQKFESKKTEENITRRPKRTIVGFDHALELNAVLWNDEKGKKFLRKIIQNKRQR